MRIYRASSEEALRAREFLKTWTAEGLLTPAQHQRMAQDAACDLRTTNIFLRLVLFFFTFIVAVAAAALFFTIFISRPSGETTGVFLLMFAAIWYAAAEFAVCRWRFYRYGIEEALLVCSIVFLCAGLDSAKPMGAAVLVPAAGAVFSLWIWRRFGLAYVFFAAMIFAAFVGNSWTSSPSTQHVIGAAFYATGLIGIVALRSRHRLDYLNDGYSIAEALLWLGIYLAINLQLVSSIVTANWWRGGAPASPFPRPFYWTTWALIWCLPPLILTRGILRKDRLVIAAGAIAFILTFVSNKPYLGWERHTWDPMLLGAGLIGVALFLRRWLARGPDGIRHGFTARRLAGKDKQWMNTGSAILGAAYPHAIAHDPPAPGPDVHFGGGDSGGGGATTDF